MPCPQHALCHARSLTLGRRATPYDEKCKAFVQNQVKQEQSAMKLQWSQISLQRCLRSLPQLLGHQKDSLVAPPLPEPTSPPSELEAGADEPVTWVDGDSHVVYELSRDGTFMDAAFDQALWLRSQPVRPLWPPDPVPDAD